MPQSKNMKSQLSKKLIKNFVNTHRKNEHLITKFDVEKERATSNEKKIPVYRKASNSKDKKDNSKRQKSSIEKAGKVSMTKMRKTPTFESKLEANS